MTATDDLDGLLTRFDPLVWKLSYRIARRARIDVDDARQELLLRVTKDYHRLRGDARFSGLFCHTLDFARRKVTSELMSTSRLKDRQINAALGRGRGDRLGEEYDSYLEKTVAGPAAEDPAAAAERNELRDLRAARVRAALEELRAAAPRQHECVVKRYGLDGKGDGPERLVNNTGQGGEHNLVAKGLDRLRELL